METVTVNLKESINEVFQPLMYVQTRILLMVGSAGSGKSVAAAQKLVIRCLLEGGHKFIALRKVGRTVRESVWSEILWLIDEWHLREVTNVTVNKSEFWILIGTSKILFAGLDDPEKIKSIQGITGIWIEEATELTADDFDQLNLRLRGETSSYKQIICSYNPISEDHWLKRRFHDIERPDVFIHRSNYLTNKFLDASYRETLESYKETNPTYYQVYCLGEWGVADKTGKFCYMFDRSKHVTSGLEIDYNMPVRLSFDFNVDPMTVAVYQMPDNFTIHFVDQIRLGNSDIYQVSDRIRATYPNMLYLVTGDASGNANSGVVRGKTSFWKVIKTELLLNRMQMRIRKKNISLIDSRVICNAALKIRNVLVDERCTDLINDLTYAKVDERGLLIKDRENNKNDHLDTFRYAIDCEWPKILKHKPKFKQI